jgi:hypothetical protein
LVSLDLNDSSLSEDSFQTLSAFGTLRSLQIRGSYATDESLATVLRANVGLTAIVLDNTVTYLHQYQRELLTREVDGKPETFVVVTLEDIALANRLAHEVLGRSIDELRPQTRKLLHLIHAMVSQCGTKHGECRFTRRQIRKYTGWGQTQLKTHLRRLEDMEYLIVHRGGARSRMLYELNWDGRATDGKHRLAGLADVDQLKPPRVTNWSGGK